MVKLLNLQSVFIYKINILEDSYEVKIGFPGKEKCCPYCRSKKYIKSGFTKMRKVHHGVSLSGLPIILTFRCGRFKCKKCNKTWSKKPPANFIMPGHRRTKVCELQILRTLKTTNFKETCEQSFASYSTVRNILERNIADNVLLKIPKKGNLTLGLDEHSKAKRTFATTITLLKPGDSKVIGVLPTKNNKDLMHWFITNLTPEELERVTEVCVDMAHCWINPIKQLFPNAKIVIDHFHVIKYLNDLIMSEFNLCKDNTPKLFTYGITTLLRQSGLHWSKRDKKRIQEVFKRFPRVEELWYWKEEIRSIYRECPDRQEAKQRWKTVLDHLDKVPKKTLSFHLEAILNYFNKHTTNAFTEGVHTKFKLIKRLSYGIKNTVVYLKRLFLGLLKRESLIINNTV